MSEDKLVRELYTVNAEVSVKTRAGHTVTIAQGTEVQLYECVYEEDEHENVVKPTIPHYDGDYLIVPGKYLSFKTKEVLDENFNPEKEAKTQLEEE